MATSSDTSLPQQSSKILVVDDHPVIRQGLVWLLRQAPDLEAHEGADNAADALQQIKAMRPDLVVIDISLKESQGIELIELVKAFDPMIKMLAWSMFDETVFAERALRAGAAGYVNKQESSQAVVAAIRLVLQGEMYLSPTMTNRLLQRLTGGQSLRQNPIESLSDRELETFQMIGRGMTAQQIAHRLGLKPRTVETLRERIKVKLSLGNAAELNMAAARWLLENG